MTRYAEIALPLPLDQTFTYEVPPEFVQKVAPGMRALVPFAGRTLTGFVVGVRMRNPSPGLKIKSLKELPDDTPVLPPVLLSFTRALANAYFIPWGEVLMAGVPPAIVPRSRAAFSLTEKGREALAGSLLPEDEREVAACLVSRPHTARFLERRCRAANPAAILERLRRRDLIAASQELKRIKRRERTDETPGAKQLELDFSLDESSRRAAEEVSRLLDSRKFAQVLLYGPRDRRRAVYFELIRRVLAAAGRVAFIIPEIALTPALIEAMEKRLGEAAAVVHSGLTEARREGEWQKIRQGRAQVIVGSRLSLFAPVDGVRLIICDEEQDESYAQQEGLPYDVRAAARLRAAGESAAVVYGSSAPSVELYYRFRKAGRLLEVQGNTGQRTATLVSHQPSRGLIAPELERAIRARLARREPVILFLNRRGYAASVVCSKCGLQPRCSRCSLPLSYHKREAKFVCHYCRSSVPATAVCPRCGGRLVIRQAVGVEAVAEDLKKRFPQSRVEIFAADEAGRKEQKDKLRLDFQKGSIDILIGTQFLAHQAEFPRAPLVGVLHPEFGLRLADFRSAQKTYLAISRALQFLAGGEGAEAFIQTSAPDHFSIREAAAGNYRSFYEQEIAYRRLMGYPPFSALAEVQFMGDQLRRVAAAARTFSGRAKEGGPDISVFGPSLAPAAKVRGLYRVQIVLKAPRRERLHRVLGAALSGIGVRRSVVLSD